MKDFLPISKEDMKKRGWKQVDFTYVIGDAYVDHSSFGPAIISRVLESRGFKVGYDYSIPIENSVPGDKGKPMFLMDVLKEDESDFYTDEYKYKTLIIDFLKEQGVK